MEVIGEDGLVYDIDDDEIEGDVMGYAGPMEDDDDDDDDDTDVIVGYDDDGSPIIVGRRGRRKRRRRRRLRGRNRHLVSVKRPKFRRSQLAPGVIAPDQGMVPLPLTGQPSNTFALAQQTTLFTGQLQKPFRGERLLVTTVRTGATATGRLLGQFFVGTDLQQADITRFDIEQVGAANAFGVRLTMKPAQPGVVISLDVNLSSAIAGTDTIFTSVLLLGRIVH